MATRSIQSFMDQIDSKIDQLKTDLVHDIKEQIVSEIKSYINDQCETIKKLNETIIRHEWTIQILQNSVDTLKNANVKLKKNIRN